MNKWIKFQFKNRLRIYLIILGVAIAFLTLLALKSGELFMAILLIAIFAVGAIGAWFGNHYGIKVTEEYYLLICSASVKRIPIKSLSALNINFVKNEMCYEVYAVVYLNDGQRLEFIWGDVYCVRGGKLKIDVTDENLQDLIDSLSKLKKVHVKVITK